MLEIKIVFKSGHIGYFTSVNEEEPTEETIGKLRELIRNAKQQSMIGSFELRELKNGYLTVIDIQEVASFGTKLVEKEEIKNVQNCISKRKKRKAKKKNRT
jgi:hypothetical protein